MWESVCDGEKLTTIVEHPSLAYSAKLLDQLQLAASTLGVKANLEQIEPLLTPTLVRHTVIHVVTTDGRILSRSRKGGQFCKFGSGGGKYDKSLVHCHFSARDGVYDEFGIGFRNPAVLDVSAPRLTVEAPHKAEQERNEEFSVVWVQYLLLDANQIQRSDEEMFLDKLPAPGSDGDWAHYIVGGEQLKCPGVDRPGSKTKVSFCLEPLEQIKQGPLKDFVRRIKGDWTKDFTEWRDVDFASIMNHREEMIRWIDDYKGESRPAEPEVVTLPLTWGSDPPYEKFDKYVESADRLCKVLLHDESVWQKPWPDTTRQVSIALRSHSWGRSF